MRILYHAGVKNSPVRVLVYSTLFDAGRPMSGLEIELKLSTVDRSTITRVLNTFMDARLLHRIYDGSGATKYEVCRVNFGEDSDEHAHFHCRKCGKTICLEQSAVPPFGLPEGYKPESTQLVVTGLCPDCNK